MANGNNKMCGWCEHIKDRHMKRTLIRKRRLQNFLAAKRDAIKAGKVVVMTQRDELTGWFYRYDKKSGNLVTLGKGTNYVR